jgi:RNA polymerase sigma-70 factor (ECF subfamily)
MPTPERLAEQFEEHRPHLRAVAYRMLGSASEAEDSVQESWIRLGRTDVNDIEHLRAWLTTVVARECLDMLRSRTSRLEVPWDTHVPDPVITRADADPESDAIRADSVGLALLVVLETLEPAERLAFVLHDVWLSDAPAGRSRLLRQRLHDRQRKDRRDEHPCRSRASRSARSLGDRSLILRG